jgi:hypothetical protein
MGVIRVGVEEPHRFLLAGGAAEHGDFCVAAEQRVAV